MADIKETLYEAKKQVEQWEEKVKSSKSLEEKIKEAEKKLKDFESKKQKAINDTMAQHKKEINDHYNAIVVDMTKKKNECLDKKKAEIRKNKQERIENETRENKQNIELFKNQISDLLKENKILPIAGTDFYFTYFKVNSAIGFIKALITYIVLIVCLPLLVSYIMMGNQMFQNISNIVKFGAVFIINLFVWACLWLIISHATEMPQDVFLKLKNLKYNIDDNKKQIKLLSKSIMNDNDNSKYDYTDTDREIEQIELDLKAATEQNEKDLNVLNTSIHDEIVRKIEEEASQELSRLKEDLNKDKAEYSILTNEIEDMNTNIKEKYESLVGKENLNSEKIEKLIQVLNNNNEQDLLLKQAIEMAKKK